MNLQHQQVLFLKATLSIGYRSCITIIKELSGDEREFSPPFS